VSRSPWSVDSDVFIWVHLWLIFSFQLSAFQRLPLYFCLLLSSVVHGLWSVVHGLLFLKPDFVPVDSQGPLCLAPDLPTDRQRLITTTDY
jgi:hypothetical protein